MFGPFFCLFMLYNEEKRESNLAPQEITEMR